jgi:hypothetical protein
MAYRMMKPLNGFLATGERQILVERLRQMQGQVTDLTRYKVHTIQLYVSQVTILESHMTYGRPGLQVPSPSYPPLSRHVMIPFKDVLLPQGMFLLK